MDKPNKANDGLRVVSRPGFTWVNIPNPTKELLAGLKGKFPQFLDIDLRDCLPPYSRPKLLERQDYLFMVLLWPIYDRESRSIRAAETDIFIGRDFVVTVYSSDPKPIKSLSMGADGSAPDIVATADNPADFLHAVLRDHIMECFPMLTHVANDVASLEERLTQDTDHQTVKDILRVKSNIFDFRRTMQFHKHTIEKFIASAPAILKLNHVKVYFEDLVGMTKEIWDFLDNDRVTIEAVYESYMSLITYQTSEASKTLTALAFIVFPTTLTAAIFAMRAEHMPFIGLPGDFWLMLGFVFLTMACTVGYLKSRKWL
jgi:magnesium transporter